MGIETETMALADLTRYLDNMALEAGMIEENPVFEEVCEHLDGPAAGRDRMRDILRSLIRIRIADPKGFDVLCLKALHPDLTHAQITEIMTAAERAQWGGRQRCVERVARLLDRFPFLAAVLRFDRRGGARTFGHVSGRTLAGEYRALKQREAGKPAAERIRALGPDGLYAELATRYRICDTLGRPGWEAVRARISRARAGQ